MWVCRFWVWTSQTIHLEVCKEAGTLCEVSETADVGSAGANLLRAQQLPEQAGPAAEGSRARGWCGCRRPRRPWPLGLNEPLTRAQVLAVPRVCILVGLQMALPA